MILPAVRERLEPLLRLPALEGTLAELRSNSNLVGLSGLQDVAKALVAAYLTHELRRPAFVVTESNRRAEELAEVLRFFSQIFPGLTGGVVVLPAFDSLHRQDVGPVGPVLITDDDGHRGADGVGVADARNNLHAIGFDLHAAAAAEALLAPPEFAVDRFQRYGYAGRKPVDGGHKAFAVGLTGRFESEH